MEKKKTRERERECYLGVGTLLNSKKIAFFSFCVYLKFRGFASDRIWKI